MAVFQKLVPAFNRAPVPLNIRFDGQDYTMQPGEDFLPEICVLFAKNQNPVFGSADPNNPHVSGGRYLIVEKGEDGYGQPLTAAEWTDHCGKPSRYDEESAFREKYAGDPKARLVVWGKGRASTANSRYEAGGQPTGLAEFSGKA